MYITYTYDSNDQFNCTTTAACTFATWQSALNGTSTTYPLWSSDKSTNAKGLVLATYASALVASVNSFTWTT